MTINCPHRRYIMQSLIAEAMGTLSGKEETFDNMFIHVKECPLQGKQNAKFCFGKVNGTMLKCTHLHVFHSTGPCLEVVCAYDPN
jgi:hypothetical protein